MSQSTCLTCTLQMNANELYIHLYAQFTPNNISTLAKECNITIHRESTDSLILNTIHTHTCIATLQMNANELIYTHNLLQIFLL